MEGDEIQVLRELVARPGPVQEVVRNGHLAGDAGLHLLHEGDDLEFTQLVIGPRHQGFIAHAQGHHDLRIGSGEADAFGHLALVLLGLSGLATQPHAEHHAQPQVVLPDDLQDIPAVLVRAVEPDELPVAVQDAEILQYLRLAGEQVLVGILTHAVAGIANGIALPPGEGEVRGPAAPQPGSHGKKNKQGETSNHRLRSFRSCSMRIIIWSSRG